MSSMIDLTKQDPTLPSQLSEKQALLNSLPASDEELYSTWKRLEAHKEFLQLQEVRPASCLELTRRSTSETRRSTSAASCSERRKKSSESSLSLLSSANSSRPSMRSAASSAARRAKTMSSVSCPR